MTCTGPVSGMTDGEQRVVINGTDAGNDYTVWYSSYSFPTLQSLTATGTCLGTAATPIVYRDTRDSQLYYVAKLADNKCWTLDNLRYKPNGDTSGTNQASFTANQVWTGYLTANGTNSSTAPNYDSPKYIDPIASTVGTNYCSSNTNKPVENISKCGLLYNFYTATAGTAPQSQATNSSQASGSICPVNWQLPSGYNASDDFGVLDIAMGGTGSYNTTSQVNWLYNGAFRGVFSGYRDSGFDNQGSSGSFWSRSVISAIEAWNLYFNSGYVIPGGGADPRSYGFGVRCLL